MAETMEEYMCKTRGDYGSGVTRPKFDDKAHFELKGQFLKELHDNIFIGSDHEDANEHIEKEVILFYNGLEVPTRQIFDSKGAIPTMTSANAKIAIQEMVEHSQKWHNGTSTKTRSTENSDGLAAIQAQLNNLGKEIKKVNEKDFTLLKWECKLCKGFHYTNDYPLKKKEKPLNKHIILNLVYRSNKEGNIGQQLWDSTKRIMVRPLYPRAKDNQWEEITEPMSLDQDIGDSNRPDKQAIADLGACISVMPFSTYSNLGLGELAHTKLIIELANRTVKHPKAQEEFASKRICHAGNPCELKYDPKAKKNPPMIERIQWIR
ncbi:hypothetical protein Tco_0241034 [Tanacetum coccineum]